MKWLLNSVDKCLMEDIIPSKNLIKILSLPNTDILEPIKILELCPQHKEHHPEGNVLIHTMMVIDEAAKYREEINSNWIHPFMWAVLFHDVGKPDTTDLKKLTAYNHDVIGAKITKNFLKTNYFNDDFTKKVVNIIRCHMRPRMLIKQKSSLKAWKRTLKMCRLDILAYITICDSDGRELPKQGKTNKNFIKIMKIHEQLKSI